MNYEFESGATHCVASRILRFWGKVLPVSRQIQTLAIAAMFSLFVSPVFSASLADFAGKEGSINIAGGTAHIPVMKEVAKHIMTANPKVTVTVAGGGSGVGVKQLGEGLVDIGNTGRPITEKEMSEYNITSFAFAIDGVAIAVHAENSVSGLTTEQIKDIYAGKITNWKEVGGHDAPISLYTREDGSGTREVFVEKGIAKGDILQTAAIVSSNGAMKTAVSKDKNAIGYVGIGNVDQSIKAVQVNGIAATQENAASGKYPVTRKLYMNITNKASALTKAFIQYVLHSQEGKAAIVAAGYIPLEAVAQ